MYDKSRHMLKIRIPTIQTRLLFMWFCELFVLTVVRFVLSRMGIYEGLTRSLILTAIASVPVIILLFQMTIKKLRDWYPFLVLFLFIIVSIVISLLANPKLIEYFTKSNYGIDRILRPDCALYAFLFFVIFRNPKELIKEVSLFAYLDFVYLIIVMLVPALSRGYWIDIGAKGQEIHSQYSLSFGYSMVFPTIIFIYLGYKKRKISALFLSLIGLWSVFTQGNRGALVIPIIFIGLLIISGIIDSKDIPRKAVKIGVVIAVLFLIAVFGNTFLKYIGTFLHSMGISSRSIDMLLQGEFTNNNGRDLIWVTVVNAIRNGGVFGYGVLGDRPFVAPIHYVGYSHNIFLELICSFGIIGVGFSLYIIIDAIRMIFFCKDTEWRELYIILLSVSCQLFISMSFWYVWEFWAAVAVAYKYKKLYGIKTRI